MLTVQCPNNISIYESKDEINDPNYIDKYKINNISFNRQPYLNINNNLKGHTQTIIANSGLLFTGVKYAKPNNTKWTKNIAVFRHNTNENIAFDIKNKKYVIITGLNSLVPDIYRLELVSNPACNHLMFAINDTNKKLHLFIYNYSSIANTIEKKLSSNKPSNLDINRIAKPKEHIINYKDLCQVNKTSDFSFQGFSLDNSKNIYLSSGFGPSLKLNNIKLNDNNNIYFFPATNITTNACSKIHIDHAQLLNYLKQCKYNNLPDMNVYFEIEGIQAFDDEGNGGNNCLVNITALYLQNGFFCAKENTCIN